ncbi:alpha/beta fold hydrolase [Sphingorhabdus sp. 109]|jgi:lysophospholipase|uniref:alpha/beta fold hydrolase n=1 Tax=Sphingorhabdus sp. 109 TaxID=2653173 RepID=UPI0012F01314|nr:alpha/beta hydrolase [Sphingorhabdus sp. 109]VWX58816.1 Lysophospholipase L2 [Sphingorhabdus sp. 109]
MTDLKEQRFDRRSVPADATEGTWNGPDGWQFRKLDWLQDVRQQEARGSVLFMTGRADFYEKYLETFHDFHARGWNVTSVDWRGQGGSGRCGPHPHVGHIDDFATWVGDLEALFGAWRASHPGPHIVVGHSMGGHIVLRAMTEQRIRPDAAILSAPMLAPAGGGMPEWAAQLAAKIMCMIGRGARRAWKPIENPLEPYVPRQALLTHDADRYADEFFWFRERPYVRLGPASWRWVERAYSSTRQLRHRNRLMQMDLPVLVLATSTDELVDHPTIERAVHLIPRAELKLYGAEAAHEIFREVDQVRNDALASCFSFLDRVTPKT